MFGKINHHHIKGHLVNFKNFVGQRYVYTKNILNDIDRNVMIARKIYGAIAPALESLAGKENFSQFNKKAINGLTQYDNIKSHVVHHHNEAEKHYHNLQHNFNFA